MNILAVNNYSIEGCIKRIQAGQMPAQHDWGVGYLRAHGHHVDCIEYTGNEAGGGRIKALIHNFRFACKLRRMEKSRNCIISFTGKLLDFLALLKKIGLFPERVKIMAVVHHYSPLTCLAGYDAVLFLSPVIMDVYGRRYPGMKSKMHLVHWGPDLAWYDSIKDIKSRMTEFNDAADIRIYSNGKSRRDNQMVLDAARESGIPFYYVSSEGVCSSLKDFKFHAIDNNVIQDHELMAQMDGIAVIPVEKLAKSRAGSIPICGLTSILDALAMGHPMIVSDNTYTGIDYSRFGYVYKAGDRDDFKKKLNLMMEDRKRMKMFGDNCRRYAQEYDYKRYCKELEEIIREVLEDE